jgi:hypothetical protein
MYCETPEEHDCFKRLKDAYPSQHEYLLDLMAWVFINKPERFNEIIKEHQENTTGEKMIDLENFDIKTIMKPPAADA